MIDFLSELQEILSWKADTAMVYPGDRVCAIQRKLVRSRQRNCASLRHGNLAIELLAIAFHSDYMCNRQIQKILLRLCYICVLVAKCTHMHAIAHSLYRKLLLAIRNVMCYAPCRINMLPLP